MSVRKMSNKIQFLICSGSRFTNFAKKVKNLFKEWGREGVRVVRFLSDNGVQSYSVDIMVKWRFYRSQPPHVKHKHDIKCTSPSFALLCHQLNIEKGGAVPYRELVTILRLASMQYITKPATTQSQNPWSTLPQNIK
jgi:hypothetical protein